jgi:hypothetical protein
MGDKCGCVRWLVLSKLLMVSEKSCRSAQVNSRNECNEISLHAYRTCNFYCVVAGSSKRGRRCKMDPRYAGLSNIDNVFSLLRDGNK